MGKSLSLGNEPYTIVGVIGKDFVADPQADLWLPFQFEPVSDDMNHFFQVAGLLQPGVTVAQANAQLLAAEPGVPPGVPENGSAAAIYRWTACATASSATRAIRC